MLGSTYWGKRRKREREKEGGGGGSSGKALIEVRSQFKTGF